MYIVYLYSHTQIYIFSADMITEESTYLSLTIYRLSVSAYIALQLRYSCDVVSHVLEQ